MNTNHREDYDSFIFNMPEDTAVHKHRKGLALLKYATMFFQDVYDERQFGVNKPKPSNDEVK